VEVVFRGPDGNLIQQEQVPRLLARCESRDEALRLICDLAEETEPGAVAGVTIAQGNGSHIVKGFFPSLPQCFSDALRLLPVSPPFIGPCAQAICKGEIVTSTKIITETRFDAAWRERCLGVGIASLQVVPVFAPEHRGALGTFVMAFWEPRELAYWKASVTTPLAFWTGIVLEGVRSRSW
jgi:GAF domain-containing protein